MQGRGSVNMPSWVKALGTATVLAAMLAGCGVRGSLDAPAAEKAEPTADASSGQGKPQGARRQSRIRALFWTACCAETIRCGCLRRAGA